MSNAITAEILAAKITIQVYRKIESMFGKIDSMYEGDIKMANDIVLIRFSNKSKLQPVQLSNVGKLYIPDNDLSSISNDKKAIDEYAHYISDDIALYLSKKIIGSIFVFKLLPVGENEVDAFFKIAFASEAKKQYELTWYE